MSSKLDKKERILLEKAKNQPKVDDGIEHIPIIPQSVELEKKKKQARKKADELREKQTSFEPIVITMNGEAKKATDLTYYEQQIEYMRCAEDPIYYIETYLTVFDQTVGEEGKIVPFKLFPFQRRLIDAYTNERFCVANKYRQAGVSTCTSAFIAWYIAFNENRNVAIVADKKDTARDEMMKDVVDFLASCPEWLVPQAEKDTQGHKIYDNQNELKAFASNSLRGFTPTLLFWDEVAWAEKGDKFWKAARPALQTGGKAIFVSTPAGLDPVFYKTFQGAKNRDNNNNFFAVELWWYNDPRYNTDEDGNLDLEWIKNEGKETEVRIPDEDFDMKRRAELADAGWVATSSWFEATKRDYNGDMRTLAQEVLCSFLGSGDNFIAEEFIKRIEENEIMTPIRQDYEDREFYIFEDYDPNSIYIQSVDVSSGHGEDFSTINICKIEETIGDRVMYKNGKKVIKKSKMYKAVQVAEYYNKVTPQKLGEIAYEFGNRYGEAYTIIDTSNGYGVITVEKMFELGFENIHFQELSGKVQKDKLGGYIRTKQKTLSDGKIINVDMIPGFVIGSNRGSILIEMQRCINMQDVVIRSTRTLNEFKTFVTVTGNRVADHKRSFHDDSIMSLSMLLYILNYQMFNLGDSKEKVKKTLDALLSVNTPKNERPSEKQKHQERNATSRVPDYRSSKQSPYGGHSWLFKGL